MLVAEACLLQAVRDKLIADLALDRNQCDVELDDQIPAIATNDYYAVTAAGIRSGPRQASSGGVFDSLFSVRVTLFRRVPEVARDRRRNVFIDLLKGTSGKLDLVIRSLAHNYVLINNAKQLLLDEVGSGAPSHIAANATGEWPEPFRTFTPDNAPRMVYREPYDAAQMAGTPSDPIVAIARGIVFSGARYMQVKP